MGGRIDFPLWLFNSPPLEEGGVPEGRGGYSPLWKIIPFWICSDQLRNSIPKFRI